MSAENHLSRRGFLKGLAGAGLMVDSFRRFATSFNTFEEQSNKDKKPAEDNSLSTPQNQEVRNTSYEEKNRKDEVSPLPNIVFSYAEGTTGGQLLEFSTSQNTPGSESPEQS